jgi:hypothetical protein
MSRGMRAIAGSLLVKGLLAGRRVGGEKVAISRAWDIQCTDNWWLSLGFHIDHKDPSIVLHLPLIVIYLGRCKQPGFKYSLRRRILGGQTCRLQKH